MVRLSAQASIGPWWKTSGRTSSMPCAWSACSCVQRTASIRPTWASRSWARRSGDVSTSTVLLSSWTRIEQRRRRLRASAGSAAPQSPAPPLPPSRGTPVDDPQPRTVMRTRSAPRSAPLGPLRLGKQAEEILRRRSLELGDADALELGDLRGGMGHVGGLIGLAALRDRREVGRIGLHQQPLERNVAHDGAQALGRLEGDDARDRDIQAERQRAPRHLGARTEAVDHARESALGILFLEHVAGLGVGIARMDDQRQAGLARRGDMDAEALGLFVARTVLVIEVEPGLADADHLGMARRLDQPFGGTLPLLLGLVRMDTNRAPDIAVTLGDRPHALELVEPRADGQHAGHTGGARARQDACFVGRKLG